LFEPAKPVMPGLVPGIHVFADAALKNVVTDILTLVTFSGT
jgi:hypothetical protein